MVKASSVNQSELRRAARNLIKAVKGSSRHSRAPYSGIKVSAGVYCRSGAIYTAVNVENASYSLSMCAERAVLYKAWSEGERDFSLMLLWSPQVEFITPCGACLQVISELAPGIVIASANSRGELMFYPLATLLPRPFRS